MKSFFTIFIFNVKIHEAMHPIYREGVSWWARERGQRRREREGWLGLD